VGGEGGGVNFPGPNATHTEVAAWKARHAPPKEEWHDFAGKNCTRPCRGWDGKDGRCDCGNRRVYWTDDDGHRYAMAD
jgi:hypothetical protein